MRDNVFWRKESRLIMALSKLLAIDPEAALDVFYSTETCRQLSDPKTGLRLMSDGFLLENIFSELNGRNQSRFTPGRARTPTLPG